jgi:NAD(P)H-flavin reductase
MFRLVRVRRDLADTATLFLEPERAAPIGFLPGQFNMLYVFGQGEVPVSISGDPGAAGPLEHTVRAVGPVTAALVAARPGDRIGVRGPYGTGWPLDEAAGRDLVVVAGGIGLAPLRPAIRTVLRDRGRFGRFVLLYGARTPGDILFRRQIERWSGRPDAAVAVTVDRATADWHGHVGVVTKLIGSAAIDPPRTIALVCGPETMMRFATAALDAKGVAAERIFVSLERNMKCAIGLCGRCQLGPTFVCRDGPVFRYDRVGPLLATREL